MARIWYNFRYRLASWIVGFDVLDEVDSAYEAGVNYGRSVRYGNDPL